MAAARDPCFYGFCNKVNWDNVIAPLVIPTAIGAVSIPFRSGFITSGSMTSFKFNLAGFITPFKIGVVSMLSAEALEFAEHKTRNQNNYLHGVVKIARYTLPILLSTWISSSIPSWTGRIIILLVANLFATGLRCDPKKQSV